MPRRLVDLSGTCWQLGQVPAGSLLPGLAWQELGAIRDWLDATVPGNIRADLVRAGRLPELTRASAVSSAQWVDNFSWWLVRDFGLPLRPGERAHLILRGVDYIGETLVNGQYLGRHEGMFSPQQHEITDLIHEKNRLAVRITGSRWLPRDRSHSWAKLLNRVEARFGGLAPQFPHRRDTLKCQMGFGWDFAPPMRTMGIWDKVYVVISEQVSIREVRTRQEWSGGKVTLVIGLKLEAWQEASPMLRCTLTGDTFHSEPVLLEQKIQVIPGENCHTVELAVPAPRLWWPWDHGRPDLYRLSIDLHDGDRLLDSTTQPVGLRRLELKDWTIRINDRDIYARGANWVPADILPGRVEPGTYDALLTLARQANMNMIRVWGGGLREKRSFYELCDRLGILVWQELPFACAFLTRYPDSPDYLRLVEAEVGAIVRDLRAHPSLALWCGGNEFSPRRNAPLVTALQRTVTAEDPDRPFLPASPAGGDTHNWHVWHGFRPSHEYRDDRAAFASEFGLQAPPSAAALRQFIPQEEIWPPGPLWRAHGADLDKLWHYARPFLTQEETTLESFVRASQRAQAQGLQTAIEHFRRRKACGCGGILVWQFNEPWPAISWSLLDYFRQPKPAYRRIQRLYRPVLLSVEYSPQRWHAGDQFQARVWAINDSAETLPGCHMEARLWTQDGQVAHHLSCTFDVMPASAQVMCDLKCTLPEGDRWHLTCRLTSQDRVLSVNAYDLAVYDPRQPAFRRRVWDRVKDWLLGT